MKKIYKVTYNKNVSESFLHCADKQLTPLLEAKTSINSSLFNDSKVYITFSRSSGFNYQKGNISKIASTLLLRGLVEHTVCWQSKSGRVYDIADEDIDCNDITFWFEDLDIAYCQYLVKPVFSLLGYPRVWAERFEKQVKKPISQRFIVIADKQLSLLFEQQTGLKMSRNICLMPEHHLPPITASYTLGAVSRMPLGPMSLS